MSAHQRYMSYLKNELYHHGVLGQKWGVRRFQNKDGTLTSAGKKHRSESMMTSKNADPLNTVGTGGGGGFTYNEDALDKELSERILSDVDISEFGDADDPEFVNKVLDRLKQVMLSDRKFNDGGDKPHPTREFIDFVTQRPDKILRGIK